MKNNGEPTIAETPSDEIVEQSTLQTKNNSKQAENEQDAKTLSSENKLDRNKENIQYMEIDAEGVKKTQIMKKTGEKEMEIRGIIRPEKVRITKETVEMTRSGLIDVLNFSVIDRREGIPMKMDKKNVCITTKKIISHNAFKVSVPRRKMLPKKKENYKEQMDRIIGGYAQAIRKLRKEKNQSTENSSQKTGDNKPELEETPEVNYNKNQENTRHLGNKDNGEKKTKGHKVAEDLVAAKWKSRMIVRYATGAERSLNIKMIQTTNTPNMSDYG